MQVDNMPTKSVEARLSTLEANVENMSDNILDIKNGQQRSYDERNSQYTQLIQRLTTIETMGTDFKRYQLDCDDERKDQDKRLNAIESYQNRQRGMITGISAVVAVFSSIGTIVVDKVFR